MAVLTLNGGSVSISSSWYYRYDPDERDYLYGTPSTGYDAVYFDLSGIPEGAEIQSAVLTASRWGSGRLLMAGVNAGTVELDPANIDPETELRIAFSFQANGGYKSGSATSGTVTASGGFQNITLTITYEMPYTAPTAPTAVTISKTTATPGESVTLSWNGANAGNNVEISGYQVYRAASADGEYALLEETAADILQVSVYAPENAGSYFYKVKTLGSVEGYDSGLSANYAYVSVSVTAPSAPAMITIAPAKQYPGGEATVSFSGAEAGENNPIRGYALWQSEKAESGYVLANSMATEETNGSFTVISPNNGKLYFKVQTLGVNLDGPQSTEYVMLEADLSGTSDFLVSNDTIDAGTEMIVSLQSNTDKAHTLIVSIAEYSETVEMAANQATVSFTPPLAWLNAMPNSETKEMTVTLITVGGGSYEKKIMLRCPDNVGPVVTGAYAVRIDNDIPSDWGVYVQGKSQARIHLETEAEMAYGSPIVRYRIEGALGASESDSVPLSMTTGYLNPGEVTISVIATDARGRKGKQQITLNVEAYTAPALKNIVTVRCDSDGVEHDEGTYAILEADMLYSACGGNNKVSVSVEYKLAEGDAWSAAQSTENGILIFGDNTIDPGSNYDVRYTITDTLGYEVIYYDVITRAKMELHIRRGGGAWAFGGVANTEGALKIYGDLIMSGGLLLGEENAGKLLYINESGKALPLSLGEGMYILDGVLNLGTPPWEETPLSDLAAGTLVYLLEADYVPYMVLAHDHHGSGLTTLIRYRACSTESRYFASIPTYATSVKYNTSALNTAYVNYYDALPAETQGKIEAVDIPIVESAQVSTIVTVNAHMFALSAMEYTGLQQSEGTQIPYFANDASRIAYKEDGTTATYVWTRTPSGGMNDYARAIEDTGAIGSSGLKTAYPLRPACCVKSETKLSKDNQGRYIL